MSSFKHEHRKGSLALILRGRLLDLKRKILEASYDHYGADLGALQLRNRIIRIEMKFHFYLS